MAADTLALCGAAGGAGTTRLTLESAVRLARDDRRVAVLDAAFATQGMADYLRGDLTPDMTDRCLDDGPLREGLVDVPDVAPGRVAVCPALAPFERVARAKAPEAAARFEARIDEAAESFDHVLVDVPPIASNQAVAAVVGTERVAIVCDAARAADAIPRLRDLFVDIGVDETLAVVTRTDSHPDADVTVPDIAHAFPAVGADESLARDVGTFLERALSIDLERAESSGLAGYLPGLTGSQ